MGDPRQELRNVKEELVQVSQQIELLLEQQQTLIQKKTDLERMIKDQASASAGANDKSWLKTDFAWSKKLEETMKSVFGIRQFRQLQLQTMNITLSGQDCILIMPTGGGKSLCFQLPALISKGVTLVISPLVSLMEDQVMALEKLNVPAVMLNASSSKDHIKFVQDNMNNPKCPFKMLYVTPEKLAKSKRFMAKLEKMYDAGLFSRIVIDEIHCCSQWGHDFRPDYKYLGVLRRQFPGVTILGLTATATNHVLQDVKKILGIEGCLVFRASFNRHNLFYEVRAKPSGMKNAMDDIEKIINSRFQGKSGIVYCLTQKDCEEVSRGLQEHGIKSGYYHSNLDPRYRSDIHERWINNKIQVVVATIAFGMGIDKPDVRFVIHHSLSKSMENYYQESGRAGRDDQQSHCILYAGYTDVARQSTMVFTEQTGIEKLYSMVEYAFDVGRCRRTLIARHFGESWDSSQCNMMCDHCNKPLGTASSSKKDITSLCRDITTILEHAKKKEQRVTALKLLESAMGRGASNLRVASITPTKLSQPNMECVIMYMLLNGYLREDFHFTAYTTISYLLPGPKSYLLNCTDHKVEVDLRDNTNSKKSATKSKSESSTKSKDSTSKKEKSEKKTVKPVMINKEKSHFISGGSGIDTCGSNQGKSGDITNRKNPGRTQKRKVVIDSDSDDALDFGDVGDEVIDENSPPGLRRNRKCIVIEESEDDDNSIADTTSKSNKKNIDKGKTSEHSKPKSTSKLNADTNPSTSHSIKKLKGESDSIKEISAANDSNIIKNSKQCSSSSFNGSFILEMDDDDDHGFSVNGQESPSNATKNQCVNDMEWGDSDDFE